MRSGLCCVVILLVAGVCAFADDSLVGYWPLDGNADDLSGFGRDGVAVNGPVWASDGYIGGCVSLDGVDDYIEIGGYTGIAGGASRTCMAWINTSNTAWWNDIVGWGSLATGQRWLVTVSPGGLVTAAVVDGYQQGQTAVNDGRWHHVAVVLNNDGSPTTGDVDIYIDGVQEAAYTTVPQTIHTGGDAAVKIGVFQDSSARYFQGRIDDVRIYDRAMSASDITDLLTDFNGEGDGTTANPYRISTVQQLMLIGSNPVMLNKHFVLINDLDLSGVSSTHSLIAPDTDPDSSNYEGSPFTGTFDGGYHCIRNLTIAGAECTGLFGKIGEGGTVMNLRIENADIEGDWAVGGLCGINAGILMNCSATGHLTGQSSIGGLCGFNDGVVSGCSADSQITSEGSAGGLCGHNRYEGALTDCYAMGTIAGPRYIGGLCGRNEGNLVSCYSTCTVPAVHRPGSDGVGGLCGENVGETFESCFWDVEASGSSVATGYQDVDPVGTLGLTTAAMQKKAMYIFQGWDFVGESVNGEDDIWRTCVDGQDYPRLSWEFGNGSYGDCDAVVELTLPGSGTENDPYLISEPLHLYELCFVSGDTYPYLYVTLTRDIDMTGIRMNVPIGGSYGTFSGFFEGNGHMICRLTIDCNKGFNVGLFGDLGWADRLPKNISIIQNLHLEDVSITGGSYAGAVAGSVHYGEIINCSSTGSVYADDTFLSGAGGSAGGIAGYVSWGSVRNCVSSCSVSTAEIWSFSSYAGGLIGKVQGTVSNSYANGSVLAHYAGGLAGVVYQYGGVISNCYSTTHIETDSEVGGGIAGQNQDGELSGCFWDTDTSGVSVGVGAGSAAGVTGKSTADMQTKSTFTDSGWDFDSNDGDPADWFMPIDDYPRLMWETSALPHKYSGGWGTHDHPYQIGTKQDLLDLAGDVDDYGLYFILTSDIDLAGDVFTSALIAPDVEDSGSSFEGTAFTGVFDGNGHVIRNLTIDNGAVWRFYLGLFGMIEGANSAVKNLGVENVNIVGRGGVYYVGALCGKLNDSAAISNCYSGGSITCENHSCYLGGLCGVVDSSMLSNCYSTCTVTSGSWVSYMGGLCGSNYDSHINHCYSTGLISEGDYCKYIGAFCGQNAGTILDSYCYLFSGPSNSSLTAIDESQAANAASFAGFDFAGNETDGIEDDWAIVQGHWPKLIWQTDDGPALISRPPVTTLSGGGYADDPFQICTDNDFVEFITNKSLNCGYYVLLTDIDLGGRTFAGPVKNRQFGGHFEGNGHVIRNIVIDTANAPTAFDDLGFFSVISGSVSNLGIEGMELTNGIYAESIGGLCGSVMSGSLSNCYTTGILIGGHNLWMGGLCGAGYGIITNCYSTCTVTGGDQSRAGGLCGSSAGCQITNCFSMGSVSSGDNAEDIGGLCGYSHGDTIKNCYSTGSVIGSGNYVGGLCGNNYFSTISRCYSTGTVTGGGNYTGGLCGYIYSVTINDCYSTSHVSGHGNLIGGLCGLSSDSTIRRSYSTGTVIGDPDSSQVGGLCGHRSMGSILASFWDVDTSGIGIAGDDDDGAIGKTTLQMQTAGTFTDSGWDFLGEGANGDNEIWRMCADGVDYPKLSWEFARSGDFACGDGVDLADLQALADYWLTSTVIEPDTFSYAVDANGDGQIDLADFDRLSENWP